jgi:CheY-like chemotaxis protein
MNSLVPILLAEDNDDDVSLTRRAFERAGVLNPLHVVSDGEQAIAYLKGEGLYSNRAEYPVPNLLLLDLRMPKKDGFEVLRWLRGEPGLRCLRVVVLTSSADVRDVNSAFSLGADAFIIKPADFLRLVEFSEALGGSWLWADEQPALIRERAKLHEV